MDEYIIGTSGGRRYTATRIMQATERTSKTRSHPMPSFRHYSEQAIETVRYDGAQFLLWKFFSNVVAPLIRIGVEIILEFDLTAALEPHKARVPLEIRHATLADVDRLITLQYGESLPADAVLTDAEEYEEAKKDRMRANLTMQYRHDLEHGDRCYIAFSGTEIAHTNWTRFSYALPIIGCMFALQQGEEVFCSDGYTAPAFRGKGVHGQVNMHMLLEAKARGYRVAYTTTDLSRTRSRRGLVRLGWTVCGRLLYIIPRGLGRTFIVRLSGRYGPIIRSAWN